MWSARRGGDWKEDSGPQGMLLLQSREAATIELASGLRKGIWVLCLTLCIRLCL